jgi:hypothetical protein
MKGMGIMAQWKGKEYDDGKRTLIVEPDGGGKWDVYRYTESLQEYINNHSVLRPKKVYIGTFSTVQAAKRAAVAS